MADELKKDLLSLQYSTGFNIEGTKEEVINLTLDTAHDVETTIFGTIKDGENPVSNATVKVFDGKGVPFIHTVTDAEGNYSFNGIPVGSYSLATTAIGYLLSAPKGVSLTSGATIELDFTLTKDDSLKLGTIAGMVKTSKEKSHVAVPNVKITLMDEESKTVATTYSVDDGEFTLYDVKDGKYTVLASAHGYLTSEEIIVEIKSGSIANMSIMLSVNSLLFNGTVNGTIKNKSGNIVVNGFVGLFNITKNEDGTQEETLVAVTKTNSYGQYLFGNVTEGSYVVKAKQNV